jgi:hypothetical protein
LGVLFPAAGRFDPFFLRRSEDGLQLIRRERKFLRVLALPGFDVRRGVRSNPSALGRLFEKLFQAVHFVDAGIPPVLPGRAERLEVVGREGRELHDPQRYGEGFELPEEYFVFINGRLFQIAFHRFEVLGYGIFERDAWGVGRRHRRLGLGFSVFPRAGNSRGFVLARRPRRARELHPRQVAVRPKRTEAIPVFTASRALVRATFFVPPKDAGNHQWHSATLWTGASGRAPQPIAESASSGTSVFRGRSIRKSPRPARSLTADASNRRKDSKAPPLPQPSAMVREEMDSLLGFPLNRLNTPLSPEIRIRHLPANSIVTLTGQIHQ